MEVLLFQGPVVYCLETKMSTTTRGASQSTSKRKLMSCGLHTCSQYVNTTDILCTSDFFILSIVQAEKWLMAFSSCVCQSLGWEVSCNMRDCSPTVLCPYSRGERGTSAPLSISVNTANTHSPALGYRYATRYLMLLVPLSCRMRKKECVCLSGGLCSFARMSQMAWDFVHYVAKTN